MFTLIEKIPAGCTIRFNEFIPGSTGLFVIYPTWSIDQKYFGQLRSIYREQAFQEIPIYVIDIDTSVCKAFEQHYQLINQGKCEMYAVHSGNLIASIKQHDTTNSADQIRLLIKKLAALKYL